MMPDKNIKCPATGFSRTCREIVTDCTCPKFVSIRGKHPQTGVVGDHYGCIDSFLHILLLENSRATIQTGSEIEALRNAVHESDELRREALTRIAGNGQVRIGGNG